MKNILYWLIMLPLKFINEFILRYRHVFRGRNVDVNGMIKIFGKGRIILGDNVKINSSLSSDPVTTQRFTVLNTCEEGIIEIGCGTGISNSALVAKKLIKIGNNVQIGAGCIIYDTDFHSLEFEKRINGHDTEFMVKPVEIKDGAFIGAGCTILKGVIIGKYSVIGAGSVVTKDVPDNEIWAGNPAKYIKMIG